MNAEFIREIRAAVDKSIHASKGKLKDYQALSKELCKDKQYAPVYVCAIDYIICKAYCVAIQNITAKIQINRNEYFHYKNIYERNYCAIKEMESNNDPYAAECIKILGKPL